MKRIDPSFLFFFFPPSSPKAFSSLFILLLFFFPLFVSPLLCIESPNKISAAAASKRPAKVNKKDRNLSLSGLLIILKAHLSLRRRNAFFQVIYIYIHI